MGVEGPGQAGLQEPVGGVAGEQEVGRVRAGHGGRGDEADELGGDDPGADPAQLRLRGRTPDMFLEERLARALDTRAEVIG